jgi:hypothetical protein
MLKKNTRLKSLNLRGNSLGDSGWCFLQIKCGTDFFSLAIVDIAIGLTGGRKTSHLEVLHLGDTKMGERGLAALASMVKGSRSLKSLYVDENQVNFSPLGLALLQSPSVVDWFPDELSYLSVSPECYLLPPNLPAVLPSKRRFRNLPLAYDLVLTAYEERVKRGKELFDLPKELEEGGVEAIKAYLTLLDKMKV